MTIDLQPPPRVARPLDVGGARVTSPAPRDVWRELMRTDPASLITQSPEWIDGLCAAGYRDASRLYETPWGTRLVLPLVQRAKGWPASRAPRSSMPEAWGMGGVLASSPPEARDLAIVVEDLAADPAVATGVRPNPLHAELWEQATHAGAFAIPRRAHVLDLAGGADVVWDKRFSSNARNRVRKAERSGLEVEFDATGRLVPVFHQVLSLSVERWAEQQHEPLALARFRANRRDPLAKFERLAELLGDRMRIWVARKDGVPIATSLVLRGNNAHRTRSAMDKEIAGPTCAGFLLEWLAIQDACAAGCASYHLGESGWSKPLSHYKEKFGARPVEYAEHRFERLPLTRGDALARSVVKRAVRFRDA